MQLLQLEPQPDPDLEQSPEPTLNGPAPQHWLKPLAC